MPVTGLSKVLENMLESVIRTHCLKTWNIFNEENGDLTFRLKFKSSEDIHMPGYTVQHSEFEPASTVSFRRKSPKQIVRDTARAAKRPRRLSNSSKVSNIESDRAETQVNNEFDHDIDNIITPVYVNGNVNATPVSINQSLEIPNVDLENYIFEENINITFEEMHSSTNIDNEGSDLEVKPEDTEIYSEENVSEKSEDSLSDSTNSEIQCDPKYSEMTIEAYAKCGPKIDNEYSEMAREAYAKLVNWTGTKKMIPDYTGT